MTHPTTNAGLTVVNQTFMNSDDIIAMLNEFEKVVRRRQKSVHLSDWPVNGRISLRDSLNELKTERRYAKGSIRDEKVFAKLGQGSLTGVIRVVKIDKIHENAVEALVFQTADTKVIPLEMQKQLLTTLAYAYVVSLDKTQAAVKAFDFASFPIRVMEKKGPKIKDGKVKERRAAHKTLKCVAHRLGGASYSLQRMFAEFADKPERWAQVESIAGPLPHLTEIRAMCDRMSQLRSIASEIAKTLHAPELNKDNSNE